MIKPNIPTSKIVIPLPFTQVVSQSTKGVSPATQNSVPLGAFDYPLKQINFDGTVAYRDAKSINKNTDTLNDLIT